jgi:hypothetical protein
VHRELGRAERAGIVARDASVRPHRFVAATDDAFYEPLVALLSRTIGVEQELVLGATSNSVSWPP